MIFRSSSEPYVKQLLRLLDSFINFTTDMQISFLSPKRWDTFTTYYCIKKDHARFFILFFFILALLQTIPWTGIHQDPLLSPQLSTSFEEQISVGWLCLYCYDNHIIVTVWILFPMNFFFLLPPWLPVLSAAGSDPFVPFGAAENSLQLLGCCTWCFLIVASILAIIKPSFVDLDWQLIHWMFLSPYIMGTVDKTWVARWALTTSKFTTQLGSLFVYRMIQQLQQDAFTENCVSASSRCWLCNVWLQQEAWSAVLRNVPVYTTRCHQIWVLCVAGGKGGAIMFFFFLCVCVHMFACLYCCQNGFKMKLSESHHWTYIYTTPKQSWQTQRWLQII